MQQRNTAPIQEDWVINDRVNREWFWRSFVLHHTTMAGTGYVDT
jgi:hypothetical protein